VSDYAVRCCGCAEWSPVMSTVGGDVRLRVPIDRIKWPRIAYGSEGHSSSQTPAARKANKKVMVGL
jgi:hypothetical protein